MRHFLLIGPITALALGVVPAPPRRVLIALARGPECRPAGHERTPLTTVNLPAVTAWAEQEVRAAARTQTQASGFHRLSRFQCRESLDGNHTLAGYCPRTVLSRSGYGTGVDLSIGPVPYFLSLRLTRFLPHLCHLRQFHPLPISTLTLQFWPGPSRRQISADFHRHRHHYLLSHNSVA